MLDLLAQQASPVQFVKGLNLRWRAHLCRSRAEVACCTDLPRRHSPPTDVISLTTNHPKVGDIPASTRRGGLYAAGLGRGWRILIVFPAEVKRPAAVAPVGTQASVAIQTAPSTNVPHSVQATAVAIAKTNWATCLLIFLSAAEGLPRKRTAHPTTEPVVITGAALGLPKPSTSSTMAISAVCCTGSSSSMPFPHASARR